MIPRDDGVDRNFTQLCIRPFIKCKERSTWYRLNTSIYLNISRFSQPWRLLRLHRRYQQKTKELHVWKNRSLICTLAGKFRTTRSFIPFHHVVPLGGPNVRAPLSSNDLRKSVTDFNFGVSGCFKERSFPIVRRPSMNSERSILKSSYRMIANSVSPNPRSGPLLVWRSHLHNDGADAHFVDFVIRIVVFCEPSAVKIDVIAERVPLPTLKAKPPLRTSAFSAAMEPGMM